MKFAKVRFDSDEVCAHALKGLATRMRITVLADEMDHSAPEMADFDVERCWKVNRFSNHRKLLRALREIKPNVVWFNLVFSSFGNKDHPLAAFSGLMSGTFVGLQEFGFGLAIAIFLDATIVRAHQDASGAAKKGAPRNRALSRRSVHEDPRRRRRAR